MKTLLFSDPHFTDTPVDAYRWDIFKSLRSIAINNKVKEIVCLGDTSDRKDRHSGTLVNKLVDSFSDLHFETEASIMILAGNHDMPLTGPYFWTFINNHKGTRYIKEWEVHWDKEKKGIFYLPFSSNPKSDWPSLTQAKLIYMHQTIEGALMLDENNKAVLKGHDLPELPEVAIYSGDVHRPQFIKGITYIGTPHPIKFSETWANRVLLIDTDEPKEYQEFIIKGIRRAILDIKNVNELTKTDFKQGDQLRIRVQLEGKNMVLWPIEEEKIRLWAKDRGIYLASVEATIIGGGVTAKSDEKKAELEIMKPDDVVKSFCEDEKLSDELLQMGLSLIKEVQ